MPVYKNGSKVESLYHNGNKIKKAFHFGNLVYQIKDKDYIGFDENGMYINNGTPIIHTTRVVWLKSDPETGDVTVDKEEEKREPKLFMNHLSGIDVTVSGPVDMGDQGFGYLNSKVDYTTKTYSKALWTSYGGNPIWTNESGSYVGDQHIEAAYNVTSGNDLTMTPRQYPGTYTVGSTKALAGATWDFVWEVKVKEAWSFDVIQPKLLKVSLGDSVLWSLDTSDVVFVQSTNTTGSRTYTITGLSIPEDNTDSLTFKITYDSTRNGTLTNQAGIFSDVTARAYNVTEHKNYDTDLYLQGEVYEDIQYLDGELDYSYTRLQLSLSTDAPTQDTGLAKFKVREDGTAYDLEVLV